jgi:hypothetical protein
MGTVIAKIGGYHNAFYDNHSLNFPEPIIPTFHYSNIPIVSEAN